MSHVSADGSLTTDGLIVDAAKSKVRLAAIEYYMALSAAANLPGIGVGASLRPEVLAKADELFAASRALVDVELKLAQAKADAEVNRPRKPPCACIVCRPRHLGDAK